MKAFVAVSSLLGLAAAEAEPLYAAPVLAKAYPSWPGVVGPGFESTCYGCGLGKRSADAEPEAWAPWGLWGAGVAAHPTGISYSHRSPQGLGKRDADAWGYGYPTLAYGVAPGVNAHPTGVSFSSVRLGKREAAPWGLWGRGIAAHPTGISYSNRSPQGAYGKRSAEADAAPWGLWGPAIAAHPTGISYTNRSPQGAYGKRSADAAPWGLWGRGIAAHPTGISYSNRSPQGLGKREAGEETPAKGLHPNGATSYVGETVWGFPLKEVEKRSADAWGYGYGRGIAAHPTGISYSNRSPQGLGKREAGEETPALGLHPNGATSYVGETVWGFPLKEVEKREADAEPLYAAPVLAKAYPSWPGVVAPGFESTCFGCGLGKRSADAEPLAIGYSNRSPQGAYAYAPVPVYYG